MANRFRSFRIPLVFGLFLCFVWGAAALLHQSESEVQLILEAKSRLLEESGLEHVVVSFDGSSGNLSGEVTTTALKERAVYMVAELQGVTAVNAEQVVIRKPLPAPAQ